LRYEYYLAASPDATVDDFKLYKQLVDEYSGISFDLSENLENTINVLNQVIYWDQNNDYLYFQKKNNPVKYQLVIDNLKSFRDFIIDNRALVKEARANVGFRCGIPLEDHEMRKEEKRAFKKFTETETEIVNRLSEYIIFNFPTNTVSEV
jgi:hypothetical protein